MGNCLFLAGGFLTFALNISGGFRWFSNALNLTPDSFNGMLSTTTDKPQRINEIKQIAWVVISIVLAALFGWLNKRRTSRGSPLGCTGKGSGKQCFWIAAHGSISSPVSYHCYTFITQNLCRAGDLPCVGKWIVGTPWNSPLLSGYRDKDDLTINITTNYHQHYLDSGVISGMSRLNIQDFRVLLPKDEVETISFLILKRITNLKKTKRVTGKTAASWVVKSHPHAGERLLATQSRVVHDYAAWICMIVWGSF